MSTTCAACRSRTSASPWPAAQADSTGPRAAVRAARGSRAAVCRATPAGVRGCRRSPGPRRPAGRCGRARRTPCRRRAHRARPRPVRAGAGDRRRGRAPGRLGTRACTVSPAIRSAVGQVGRRPRRRVDHRRSPRRRRHATAGRRRRCRRAPRPGTTAPATPASDQRPVAGRQPPGPQPDAGPADGQRLERGAGRRSSPGRLRVPAERGEREDQPVEVVVDGEVAGEPGPGELRLVPGRRPPAGSGPGSRPRARPHRVSAPAATSASSAHAVCDAVEVPRPIHRGSVYERMSSPQPPSGFWCSSSQRTARRITGPCAGMPGRDQGRHRRAGAVHVVDAPPAEPGAVLLLCPQQPVDRRGRAATPGARARASPPRAR